MTIPSSIASPGPRRALACASVAALALATAGGAWARGPAPSVRADGTDLRFHDPEVTGATRPLQGDLVEAAHGAQRYFVETPSGSVVPVDFGGADLPRRARGAEVELRATAAGDVRSATISPAPRAAAVTPSAHRAYVALVSNKGAFGSSDATIRATIDAALTRWREESNGAISSFTRVENASLATQTDCASGSALYNEAATKLFPQISTNSTSGNHIIVISPPSCDAGGVGTVQAGIASGGRLHAGWNPQSTIQTLMHELGHNFSLDHANGCYEPVGPSCEVVEYANTYALMGFTLSNDPAYTPAALDSFERALLGIADAGEVAPVTLGAGQRTVTAGYDLRARGATAGLRGLRITDPVDGTAYSVDWRSAGGRDAGSDYALNPGRNNPGVTIERIAADGESAAVLGHPAVEPNGPVRYGLGAGRTFTAGGTTIAVASIGNPSDPAATARIGVTLTDPSVPAPPTLTPPRPVAPAPVPAPAGALAPAKLEVTRASVSRTARRLSIVAPITARASGTVRIAFRAAGRTTSFDAPIDTRRRRVAVDRPLGAVQARAGSGILTITYRGDADTQPQTVRIRAAARPAGLRAGRPTLTGARLVADGRISTRARGVVRVQLLFEPAIGPTRTLAFKARISRGRYRLTTTLPAATRAAIDARRGVLHSYTLFTGDEDRRLRGELASYEVLGAR